MDAKLRAEYEEFKQLGMPIVDRGNDACLKIGIALIAHAITAEHHTPELHHVAVMAVSAQLEAVIQKAAVVRLLIAAGFPIESLT